MNQLVAYESDDESPERRRSREEFVREAVDLGGDVSADTRKKHYSNKGRKNSERWTASDDEGDAREGSSRETSSHSSDSSSVGEQPPPPKRFSPFPSERSVQSDGGALSHSASVKNVRALSRMPVTQSQTSLVSYGGAGEEEDADDQFAKADKKAAAEFKSRLISPPRSRSVTVEPKPPPGHDGHEDSRSPDEIAVDSALEEGLRELREHNVRGTDSTVGSPNQSSVEGHESPSAQEVPAEVTLPPSPVEKCSRELELQFEKYFARKANGMDLNLSIQLRQDFKNPSIYERLIEAFEVDELGSNFDPSVFNPHGFTEDCFYDNISVMQKEVMEKYMANAEKKSAASGGANAAVDSSKGSDVKRKSRFEGNKKH